MGIPPVIQRVGRCREARARSSARRQHLRRVARRPPPVLFMAAEGL